MNGNDNISKLTRCRESSAQKVINVNAYNNKKKGKESKINNLTLFLEELEERRAK